jgi:hypothetical protein
MIVYGLIDPRNGELRYVGKTTQTATRRLGQHICRASRDRSHRATWVRSLTRAGVRPEMVALEEHATELALDEAEVWWIAYLRSIGCDLTNGTDGGERSCSAVPAVRRKIARARIGQDMSARHRPVIDENGNTYESLGAAADAFGVSVQTMCSALRGHHGRRRAVKNTAVAYVDEGRPVSAAKVLDKTAKGRLIAYARTRVRLVSSDGRVFPSGVAAALELGVTTTAVSQALKRGHRVRGVSLQRLKD